MSPNVELLKIEFREFCVTHLTLRWIDDAFRTAGFGRAESDSYLSGARRSRVMEYYASEDWQSTEAVRKLAKTIENVLRISFLTDEQRDDLRSVCRRTGFQVDGDGYRIHITTEGIGEQVKNLIFAADGPKPDIVLSDALSNEIEIIKNAEYCLVYDRPIQTHGLLWVELVDWWKSTTSTEHLSDVEVGRALYLRLEKSLQSPPERLVWKTYFKLFYQTFGDRLPALVPQVYLHYDPYTIQQLKGKKRLRRQRMDFLILLSDHIRVVIEVDGKHHYADGDSASPRLYSEMVAEDRKLQLAGYEVYRFGGYELQTSKAERILQKFFSGLFGRHEIVGCGR
jgi:very-short-patch-repair endonuclease